MGGLIDQQMGMYGGKSYGRRQDGTAKGSGFFGELPTKDGRVATELSIGVNLGGKERQIPLIVPGLSKAELQHLLDGGRATDEIVDKAVAHAVSRAKAGRGAFAADDEDKIPPPKD